MYKIIGQNINMTEGDFGVILPITIILEGSEHLTASDSFKISIYTKTNGEKIISKEYSVDNHNTINFELTEEETNLLTVGTYKYDLDWYQDDVFMNNIVANANFVIMEKAGVEDGS